ncbi:Retrovirus-related Pol polyprotein from transposon RE1 [Cardamine amara subsp. amara]|uniref:Retrovirus-related Pol polyprotein from transposon RE1 n=1 Tax=Cardamine amara subsp. amara TaxID=228776 RepID=A0ABD1BL97_CARAN
MLELAGEIKWISAALKEMGIAIPVTPTMYCDNLSAVYLSANPAFYSKKKDFDTDHHYVRERVALGALEVKHIPNYHQIADIFTKSLPRQAFTQLRYKLGVAEPPTQSLRGDIKRKTLMQSKTLQQHQKGEVGFKPANRPISQTKDLKPVEVKPPVQAESLLQQSTESSKDKGGRRRDCTEFRIKTENQFNLLTPTDA